MPPPFTADFARTLCDKIGPELEEFRTRPTPELVDRMASRREQLQAMREKLCEAAMSDALPPMRRLQAAAMDVYVKGLADSIEEAEIRLARRLACDARTTALRAALDDLPPPPATKSLKAKPAKFQTAMAMLARHPDWTNAEVAREIRCSPSLLSRNKDYKEFARTVRAAAKRVGGAFNARTGELEAVAPSDD